MIFSSGGLEFFVRVLGFDLIFKETSVDYENGSALVVEPISLQEQYTFWID